MKLQHAFVCGIVVGTLAPGAPAAEIEVPSDHGTIQAALDAAQPGDQVVVVGNRDLEDGSQVLSEAWAAAEEPESDGEQDTAAQGEGDG